jgi:amino acid transporter
MIQFLKHFNETLFIIFLATNYAIMQAFFDKNKGIIKQNAKARLLLFKVLNGTLFFVCGYWLIFTSLLNLGLALYLFAAVYWIVFDLKTNDLRGQRWNYIGSESYIDDLGRANPLLYYIAKVLCLTSSIVLKLIY